METEMNPHVKETSLMKNLVHRTTVIAPIRESVRRSVWQRYFLFIPLALGLACFALSPQARAVCQEGCLTNSNTVLGDDALVNNTTGDCNTAIGSDALY